MLVSIKSLTITVTEARHKRTLVDRISFDIPAEKIVGLVGGSGSGKTTTGLAILQLLPMGLQIQQGEIILESRDLIHSSKEELRQMRGKTVSMVFQEPLNAFNPVFSIGYQISEVLEVHTRLNKPQRQQRIYELLETVGIDEPKRVAGNYPHQLSGGMRQRAMIAMAIATDPKLIIADEPTSNLDVTLQARIMELFRRLRKQLRLSILLITHDLGMISHLADQVVVMKDGQIVEQGHTEQIVNSPKHDYTAQLMEALCY